MIGVLIADLMILLLMQIEKSTQNSRPMEVSEKSDLWSVVKLLRTLE